MDGVESIRLMDCVEDVSLIHVKDVKNFEYDVIEGSFSAEKISGDDPILVFLCSIRSNEKRPYNKKMQTEIMEMFDSDVVESEMSPFWWGSFKATVDSIFYRKGFYWILKINQKKLSAEWFKNEAFKLKLKTAIGRHFVGSMDENRERAEPDLMESAIYKVKYYHVRNLICDKCESINEFIAEFILTSYKERSVENDEKDKKEFLETHGLKENRELKCEDCGKPFKVFHSYRQSDINRKPLFSRLDELMILTRRGSAEGSKTLHDLEFLRNKINVLNTQIAEIERERKESGRMGFQERRNELKQMKEEMNDLKQKYENFSIKLRRIHSEFNSKTAKVQMNEYYFLPKSGFNFIHIPAKTLNDQILDLKEAEKDKKSIEDMMERQAHRASLPSIDSEVLELINEEESIVHEKKETLRINTRTEKKDPDIIDAAMKTVSAFANGDREGTLLIGVSDDKKITGIERDGYTSQDVYNQTFDNFCKNIEPTKYLKSIKTEYHKHDGKTVFIIRCPPKQKEIECVFYKKKPYRRTNSGSVEMDGPELLEYINKGKDDKQQP